MMTEPAAEHGWLKRLVGSWAFEHTYDMGGETCTSSGTEVVRMVGDLWAVGEMTGEMPGGGTMTAIMTFGFDPGRGVFVGTWIGSPSAHLWVYEGSLEGDTLTLETTGPAMDDPKKTAEYRDIVRIVSDDERTLTSRYKGEDGSWTQMVHGVYRRQG